MHEDLGLVLRKLRGRLNATIVAHRVLAWAAPAAVAAGLVTAALRALGVHAAGILLWTCLSLAGAAAGGVAARRSRLDEAGAARWLDERLADEELLSAALVCIRRESTERFDAQIVERARELIPRAEALRVSPLPMLKRAAIAAAALAVGSYLVFLASPIAGTGAKAPSAARAGAGGQSGKAAQSLAEDGGVGASAFAASLFPEDKRMATLAERALREGRMDDLRDMLKTADLEYESRLSRSVSEPERKKLASERERIQEASKAISMGFGTAGGGSGPGSGGQDRGGSEYGKSYADQFGNSQGEGGGRGKGGSKGGPRPGAPGEGEASPGSGGEGQGEGATGEIGQGEAGQGGKSYGTGSGWERNWGAIEPAAGSERAVIESSKDSSFFELVLPGQEAASPVSSLATQSRRIAESAMSREGLPLEYEDFVKSYFIQLSKGEPR